MKKILLKSTKQGFKYPILPEDGDIGKQLDDSYKDIKSLIGNFDPTEYSKGKELVYERTRYLRNESLEYFYGNFQTVIMDASVDLVGETENAD